MPIPHTISCIHVQRISLPKASLPQGKVAHVQPRHRGFSYLYMVRCTHIIIYIYMICILYRQYLFTYDIHTHLTFLKYMLIASSFEQSCTFADLFKGHVYTCICLHLNISVYTIYFCICMFNTQICLYHMTSYQPCIAYMVFYLVMFFYSHIYLHIFGFLYL